MQYVGEQQFLMLLFVIEAQFDEIEQFLRKSCHRLGHRAIDMAAIGQHLIDRRAGQQATFRPRVPCAFGFIIAVEQIGKGFVEKPIARHMVAQQKGFEKPADVREMPFGR